jgi:hypothetical protein
MKAFSSKPKGRAARRLIVNIPSMLPIPNIRM